MKKQLLTALFFSLSVCSIAQNVQWAHSITNVNQPDQVTAFDTNIHDRMALVGLATAGSNIALIDNATEEISTTLNFLAVYNGQAELLWSARTVGYPYTVMINDQDEVFVVGGSIGIQDFDPTDGVQNVDLGTGALYVQKLNANGELVWVGQTSLAANAAAICEGEDGRIFVSGVYSVPATIQLANGSSVEMTRGADILEFSPIGELIGCYSLDVPNVVDYINVLDMDVRNNQLVVVGDLDGVCDFNPTAEVANCQETASYDGFVSSFDVTNGCNLQWFKIFRGNSWEAAYAVRIGEGDDVYVGGGFTFTTDFDYESTPGSWTLFSDSNTNLQSAFFAKLNAQGEFQWLKEAGGDNETLGEGSVWTRDLELKDGGIVALIEGYGSIYMDGTTTSSPVVLGAVAAPGYMIAEYDDFGAFESVAKADTTGEGVDSFCGVFPKRLKTLSSNRFVVAGNFMQFINFGTQQNPIVLSNDPSSPNFGFDRDIFLACYIGSDGLGTAQVLKPMQTAKIINPMRDELLILEQNYDIAEVTLVNMSGARVACGSGNRMDVRNLSSGVYTVQVRLNDGSFMIGRAIKE